MRAVAIQAGPDMAVSSMVPRPIDLGPIPEVAGETFETTNPSDGSLVGRVARGGKEDMRRGIEAARRKEKEEASTDARKKSSERAL